METVSSPFRHFRWGRAASLTAGILVWAVWGTFTVTAILYVRDYSRNIPYVDDFSLVPVMSGREPLTLHWLWAQHNEHRPVVSRLIIVGLHRVFGFDFRSPQYLNALLLSGVAALMITHFRRLRGRSSVFDIAVPLSLLNIGQAETLMIGFALNLVLTSAISCYLIKLTSNLDSLRGWRPILKFGVCLLLLPLCGGSGLVMLPPLLLWLAYSCTCSDMGQDSFQANVVRAIGLGLFAACLVVVTLYFWGYNHPPHHPMPASWQRAGSTLLWYLSMAVWPNMVDHRCFAGWIAAVLVAATLGRLGWIGWRQSNERLSAVAMMSVVVAMLCAALAVAVARAFIEPETDRASRYITTTSPLFCAIYGAWLVHGSARARRLVHFVMLAFIVSAIPANLKYGHAFGNARQGVFREVERTMRANSPVALAVSKAWPNLHADRKVIEDSFKQLRRARVGQFGKLADDDLAAGTNGATILR
jgi:hypothetical protein